VACGTQPEALVLRRDRGTSGMEEVHKAAVDEERGDGGQSGIGLWRKIAEQLGNPGVVLSPVTKREQQKAEGGQFGRSR